MARTITVKGVGNVSAKPDYITLGLSVTSKELDYEKAMVGSSRKIELLENSINRLGFAKGDLKNTSFNVTTLYENVSDRQGNYRRQFCGYSCVYRFNLSFDFDNGRLSDTLAAIMVCGADPELSISFTIKDPAWLKEQMLERAAADAKARAEILCRAANVELGQLVSIDYDWSEIGFIPPSSDHMAMCVPTGSAELGSHMPEVEPDDLQWNDTARFVWEIR